MKRSHFALPEIYGEPMSFYEVLNKLGKLLNEETLDRKQSDDKLKHDIGSEASSREQADTILQQNINAEKTELSELKGDLADKIDKPATAPEAGKILKVTKVNDDGTFVCEWADAPSGGEKWEQIADIVTTEDADMFNFSGVSVNQIMADITLNSIPDSGITAQIFVQAQTKILFYLGRITKSSLTNRILFMAKQYDGCIIANAAFGSDDNNAGRIQHTSMPVNGGIISGISTTFMVPAGSKIKIYGVRA